MSKGSGHIDVARYKSSTQGLIELATLIEQASPGVRKKIQDQLKTQDYDLLIRAMRKVVFFEELIYLDESILAEILSNTPAKVMAYAIFNESDRFKQAFTRLLGLKENRQYNDEIEKIGGSPAPNFIVGAQTQILKIARKLEEDHKFAFELHSCPRFDRLTRPKKQVA